MPEEGRQVDMADGGTVRVVVQWRIGMRTHMR